MFAFFLVMFALKATGHLAVGWWVVCLPLIVPGTQVCFTLRDHYRRKAEIASLQQLISESFGPKKKKLEVV
jgi:hypothetical protein